MSTAAGGMPEEKKRAGTPEVQLPKIGEETARNVPELEVGDGGSSSPPSRRDDQQTSLVVALEGKNDGTEAGAAVSGPPSGSESLVEVAPPPRLPPGADAALAGAQSPQEQ
jgi:hypothetical protein